MLSTVVLIGFPRPDAAVDEQCRELGLTIAGAVAGADPACQLPLWQGAGPDLVLLNGGAGGIDVCDAALALSRVRCEAGVVVCGIACPRVRDTLSIMLASLDLPGACSAASVLDGPALRQALDRARSLRRARQIRPARKAPEFSLAEIEAGLARGEFELHYQPKASFFDGTLCGVEALLRWRHREHGVLTPASFLSQIEAGGLVDLLTMTVLRACLHDLHCWSVAGFHPEVSINLSPLALSNPDLAHHMLGQIRASSCAPSQLSFEITEYAEIADLGIALRNLLKLRLNGHGLSLDDYGAGHGSILQMSRIPFNEIKVDMRLVQGAWRRPHLEPLLAQAVSTAHALGMRCVAEGVETPEEWAHMRRLGFDLGQGYLIGRPMPPGELAGWRFQAGMADYSTDTNDAR